MEYLSVTERVDVTIRSAAARLHSMYSQTLASGIEVTATFWGRADESDRLVLKGIESGTTARVAATRAAEGLGELVRKARDHLEPDRHLRRVGTVRPAA